MQLPLDAEYPFLCVRDAWPRCVVIQRHSSSPPLVLLACCPPSPCGRLSRPPTTTRTPSRSRVMRRRWACPVTPEDNPVAVPTFTDLRRRGRCPAIPLQPRRASIADIRTASPKPSDCGLGRAEARWVSAPPALRQPISTRLELVDESRGL